MTNFELWAQARVPAVKVCAVDSILTPPCAGSTAGTLRVLVAQTACVPQLGSAASLCWPSLPTPGVPPAQSQRERPTEMLPCNYKDCPINYPTSRPENHPPSQPAPRGHQELSAPWTAAVWCISHSHAPYTAISQSTEGDARDKCDTASLWECGSVQIWENCHHKTSRWLYQCFIVLEPSNRAIVVL